MIRGKARKTGPFTEKANCNGVMVMSQKIGVKVASIVTQAAWGCDMEFLVHVHVLVNAQ